MKQISLTLLCLILVMVSCTEQTSLSQLEVNFPLEVASTLPVGENIQRLAITDNWAAVQVPGNIIAIDTITGERLWTLNNFSADKDSEFQITDDVLSVVNYEKILLVNRLGEQKEINLKPSGGHIFRLIATDGNYLYIIRGPDWTLEAYDIPKNALLWETWVGRGQTDAYYDEESGIAYIVTPEFINAFENSSGKLLWQQPANVKHSTFENGILYLGEQVENSRTFKVTALDTKEQKELWSKEYSLASRSEIYQLSSIRDLVVVNTGYSYFALHKDNGDQIWHSETVDDIFYNKPVEYNGILYAKAANGRLYAISMKDGNIIGLKAIGEKPIFVSRYDANQRVYPLDDGIAVNTNKEIVNFTQE